MTDLIAAIDRKLKEFPSYVVATSEVSSISEYRTLLEFVKYSLEKERCKGCHDRVGERFDSFDDDIDCKFCTERQRHIKALRERLGV